MRAALPREQGILALWYGVCQSHVGLPAALLSDNADVQTCRMSITERSPAVFDAPRPMLILEEAGVECRKEYPVQCCHSNSRG